MRLIIILKKLGCKEPDECYIDNANKTMFIIEKKFQQVSGSVCEKNPKWSFQTAIQQNISKIQNCLYLLFIRVV